MWRHVDIKKILPLLILVVFIGIIGLTMISAVRSEDRKAQAAWDEVLAEDRDMAAAARRAMVLVDRLEKVLRENPGGCPEADRLTKEIIADWPNFARGEPSGQVSLPSFSSMRRQLNFYIHRA